MLLNRLEYALMNNPFRAFVQRRFEAVRLLRMGGEMGGGRALEMGCGRGVGVEIVLDRFGADEVDAFDLDPRMLALARKRLGRRGSRVRLWVGDASALPAKDSGYDAAFDFGIIHHVPNWRMALAEVSRVLKPGGLFYAEEALAPFIQHPWTRRLLDHPQNDLFDGPGFCRALEQAGMEVLKWSQIPGIFAWFVSRKGGAEGGRRQEAGGRKKGPESQNRFC